MKTYLILILAASFLTAYISFDADEKSQNFISKVQTMRDANMRQAFADSGITTQLSDVEVLSVHEHIAVLSNTLAATCVDGKEALIWAEMEYSKKEVSEVINQELTEKIKRQCQ